MAAKKNKTSFSARSASSTECMIDVALVPYNVENGTFGDPVMIMRKICKPPYWGCGPYIFANVSPGAYAVTLTPLPCSSSETDPYYLRVTDDKFVKGTPTASDLVHIGPAAQNYTVTADIES